MNKTILISWLVASVVLCSGEVFSAQRTDLTIFNKSAEELQTLCQKNIDETGRRLDRVTRKIWKPNFKNTVVSVENILSDFWNAALPIIFLSRVAVDENLRKVTSECYTASIQFSIGIFSNDKLFERFSNVKQSRKFPKLPLVETRLYNGYIRGFHANGFLIENPKKREELVSIKKEISELESKFKLNIAEKKTTFTATKNELLGVSDEFLSGLKKEGDKYIIDSSYPVVLPVLKNVKDARVRKKAVKIFQNVGGQDNISVLEEILKKRAKVAELMGYKNHAQVKFALDDRMAKSEIEVKRFMENLTSSLRPSFEKEMKILEALKCDEIKCNLEKDGKILEEDFRYYKARAVEKLAKVNEEDIKAYFPLDHVTDAMFSIYESLMQIKIVKKKLKVKVWHPDVMYYQVFDQSSQKLIGEFFLDLFPREGKYGHYSVSPIRAGKSNKNKIIQQLPLVAMICNFNPPNAKQKSLLTHDDVETYFHEFGHLVHSMVSSTQYASQSGFGVSHDFVEAPSQMLEHWVWEKESLDRLSKHHKTGKSLPDDLLRQLLTKKNVNKSIWFTRQLMFASIDMDYHSISSSQPIDVIKIWKQKEKEFLGFYPVEGTHPASRFGHLVGYDAGYYAYLWSKVYARDMFTAFEKHGVMNPKIGRQYRDKVLAPGGSKDPFGMLEDFLGRPSNADAFTKSLSPPNPTQWYMD